MSLNINFFNCFLKIVWVWIEDKSKSSIIWVKAGHTPRAASVDGECSDVHVQSEEIIVPPEGSPGISDNPVINSILAAPSKHTDDMVDWFRTGLGEDSPPSVLVELRSGVNPAST